jgi:hypothetical protein
LIHRAESEAIKRGYISAHVDAYSFEARSFFEKLGDKVFAALEDYPQGIINTS